MYTVLVRFNTILVSPPSPPPFKFCLIQYPVSGRHNTISFSLRVFFSLYFLSIYLFFIYFSPSASLTSNGSWRKASTPTTVVWSDSANTAQSVSKKQQQRAVRAVSVRVRYTLRASLSGTFLQGCRKPVLGVWVRYTLRASLSGTFLQGCRKPVPGVWVRYWLVQNDAALAGGSDHRRAASLPVTTSTHTPLPSDTDPTSTFRWQMTWHY